MKDPDQHISDQEIRELLKQRLLEALDDSLLEQEARITFLKEPAVMPPTVREKQLLRKAGARKGSKLFLKLLIASGFLTGIFAVYFILKKDADTIPYKEAVTKERMLSVPGKQSELGENSEKEIPVSDLISPEIPTGPGVQRLASISAENGDLGNPIFITDTILHSLQSARGAGNSLEFSGNATDDPLYFEKEHNTVWYKFIARESGQLTFDIIPLNANDDYDFMLFKWTANDFHKKVLSKQIPPLRTCISRNNKSRQSITGLSLDESAQLYVHAGLGPSYVKYIRVTKGEVYYLLLDNVYDNGAGHIIRFHYKPEKPGELHVGKMITFDQIIFKDSDTEYKESSKPALDSLVSFLRAHPNLRVEIQGHVNSSGNNAPMQLPGKPVYTNQQLSEQRAITIKNYLVAQGINVKRLSVRGFGGDRPKIRNPKSRKEFLMNARAEILITAIDFEEAKTTSSQHK